MKIALKIFLFTFYFSLLFPLNAQVLNEDINNPIYNFIERLSVRKIIDVNQSVKPYSKKKIAVWLAEIKGQKAKLNKTELDDLNWYLEVYDLEIDTSISKLGQYQFLDEKFNFRALPIAGYQVSKTGDANGHSRWVGTHIEGTLDKVSMMFEYLDTGELGDNVNRNKQLVNKTGHFFKGIANGIEFSDVKGNISYDFENGSLSLKKEYVNVGSGKFGQLILSDKSPSFPHLELKFNPVDWLEVFFMHGWLNSQVLDSNNFYYSYSSKIEPRLVKSFINKYIALNYITIKPNSWLKFSLGNSFVYSGDLRPEMFIPVMYYKVMDHNTGRGIANDGNGMIFSDLNISYFRNINFYSTLLIDVLEIRSLLKGEFFKQWIGFTIGSKFVNLGINNLDFFIEYTRVNPWVYENKYTTSNYQHLNYVLGHWVGNNADLFSLLINYKFIRELSLSLKTEFLRKGGQADNYFAYENRIGLPFLFGENRSDIRMELSAMYNPFHNVYLKGKYSYSEISDEFIDRTPSFLLGAKNSFSLSLSYGLP